MNKPKGEFPSTFSGRFTTGNVPPLVPGMRIVNPNKKVEDPHELLKNRRRQKPTLSTAQPIIPTDELLELAEEATE